MRKTRLTTLAALACALMMGCTSEPTTTVEKIDQLKKQVTTDAKELQKIHNEDFARLQKDFITCDSMLQYLNEQQVATNFEQLKLTQAYILQYEEVKPIMEKKMDYVVQQLDNLKSDAESNYLSDSLVLVYLDTERKVADTLHAQVDYFKNSFSKCQKSLNELKKSYPKQ